MRCAVTGATGWLGSRCEALLRARGDAVVRLVRRPARPGDVAFELGRAVDPESLRDVDALVHCAHDFSVRDAARAWEVNAVGGRRLLEAARAAGVGRVVVVSTVAAFAGCASEYGRGKLHVEEAALGLGASVLRPGLLWSERPRGLFAALCRLASLPALAVFDDGAQPLVLAHVDDVAAAALAALDRPEAWPRAPVLTAHPRVYALRELLEAMRGGPLRAVSLPSSWGLAALGAAEGAGLALPFRRDSLVSLLRPPLAFDHGPARRLGLGFRPYAGRRL